MTGVRRLAACSALATCGLWLAPVSATDVPPPPSPTAAALLGEVQVERALLDEDLGRYRALGRTRAPGLSRLTELYAALDRTVASTEPGARERAEALLEQLQAAEAEGEYLRATERDLAERILLRIRRIALLEQQIAAIDTGAEPETGALTGVWDVVLLPFSQRGSFSLRQSGALASGTYELDGGFRGSLQGTLVNRKVFLVRVDSKLGRSMELEGYLSTDGRTIRGNWLNYELAGAQGGTGQWSATRR